MSTPGQGILTHIARNVLCSRRIRRPFRSFFSSSLFHEREVHCRPNLTDQTTVWSCHQFHNEKYVLSANHYNSSNLRRGDVFSDPRCSVRASYLDQSSNARSSSAQLQGFVAVSSVILRVEQQHRNHGETGACCNVRHHRSCGNCHSNCRHRHHHASFIGGQKVEM